MSSFNFAQLLNECLCKRDIDDLNCLGESVSEGGEEAEKSSEECRYGQQAGGTGDGLYGQGHQRPHYEHLIEFSENDEFAVNIVDTPGHHKKSK